jgi:sulfur carrier protein
MNIHINGKAYSLGDETHISVRSALTLHFVEPQHSTFAVALNGDFVGNTDYDTTIVNNGDNLDVLQPIQGG